VGGRCREQRKSKQRGKEIELKFCGEKRRGRRGWIKTKNETGRLTDRHRDDRERD
jgi:hypothetical protein